ncbi:MAG: long-chain fatty acid--CoA ligase [Desulfomonilia bacterium]|nr:long-chain fatty acid--CoA ligase [Desulfomonilia bacterium]
MEENLAAIFFNQAELRAESVALMSREKDGLREITWREYASRVTKLAGTMIDLGIEEGDRVAVFSYNSPEWAITDLASLSARAVAVPIYFRSSAPQVSYIMQDSGAKGIMVGSRDQLDIVLSIRNDLPHLTFILIPDSLVSEAPAEDQILLSFSDAYQRAESDRAENTVHSRIEGIREGDTATIVYTSGTTGEPKGVMLTHKSIIANVSSDMKVVSLTDKDVGLSFLPTSHVLDRVVVHYMNIVAGGTIAYARSLETIMEDVAFFRPTAMCGVPRMFEKIYNAIVDRVNEGPWLKKRIFHWAVASGVSAIRTKQATGSLGPFSSASKALADLLVFSKIRQLLGGRMRLFASGGAHLAEEIDLFFRAMDIPIMHGFGLTEGTCTVTLNTLDDFRPGTLGHPIPGVDIRIAEDGEILVRGDLVMKGYYNRPEETKIALEDGWLHTGDLGYLDRDGYLIMTDRKKDILSTSGGKNVSPQRIETFLKESRLIEQAVIIAEGWRFVTALIVPNFAELSVLHTKEGLPPLSPIELIGQGDVIARYQEIVDRVNQRMEGFEQIRKFTLLPAEFTLESDELTPTLKVKRRVIDVKYKDIIEKMYRT